MEEKEDIKVLFAAYMLMKLEYMDDDEDCVNELFLASLIRFHENSNRTWADGAIQEACAVNMYTVAMLQPTISKIVATVHVEKTMRLSNWFSAPHLSAEDKIMFVTTNIFIRTFNLIKTDLGIPEDEEDEDDGGSPNVLAWRYLSDLIMLLRERDAVFDPKTVPLMLGRCMKYFTDTLIEWEWLYHQDAHDYIKYLKSSWRKKLTYSFKKLQMHHMKKPLYSVYAPRGFINL